MDLIREYREIMDRIADKQVQTIEEMRLFLEASHRHMILSIIEQMAKNAPVSDDLKTIHAFQKYVPKMLLPAILQADTYIFPESPNQKQQAALRKKNLWAGYSSLKEIMTSYLTKMSSIKITDQNTYKSLLIQMLCALWNGFLSYRESIFPLNNTR